MRVFDMARIHKPRRCQRTMSCRTRISCQLGRACEPRIESVDMRYAVQPKKGRKVDSLQAVGQPNSTCETVEMRWREVEKEPYITVQLCKAISKRKHYLHIEVENIMETKLERISQLARENPEMVFTSIGHLIMEIGYAYSVSGIFGPAPVR